MKTVRWFGAVVAVAVLAPAAPAQEAPKPGPEHAMLKKMEGDWDFVMKFGGMESKGAVTYKMELGGMWLSGALEAELFGSKFQGKSLEGYDASAKKFVGVWVDSMSNRPMMMEGTYDREKKALTMVGEGPGMDGKPTKYKSVSTYPDDNTTNFAMYVGGGKDPEFTIVYTRKKK